MGLSKLGQRAAAFSQAAKSDKLISNDELREAREILNEAAAPEPENRLREPDVSRSLADMFGDDVAFEDPEAGIELSRTLELRSAPTAMPSNLDRATFDTLEDREKERALLAYGTPESPGPIRSRFIDVESLPKPNKLVDEMNAILGRNMGAQAKVSVLERAGEPWGYLMTVTKDERWNSVLFDHSFETISDWSGPYGGGA